MKLRFVIETAVGPSAKTKVDTAADAGPIDAISYHVFSAEKSDCVLTGFSGREGARRADAMVPMYKGVSVI
jgi:hypothetical protein